MVRRGVYDVEEMAAEARRQRGQVVEITRPLDAEALGWKPAARSWSVGECLDHLTMMNRIYLDAIDAAVRAAGAADASGADRTQGFGGGVRARHGWTGDAFVRTLEPPPRLKVPTFPRTTPEAARDPNAVLDDFLATQDRLVAAIEGARGVDLARVRLRSPFMRLLRLSLGQAFGAMLAHNRRHIWQAERVLERRV